MHVSAVDLARLEDASRVLLSPLVATDADAWRRASMEAVRTLFGARGATFALPGAGEAFFLGDEMDAALVDRIDTFLGPAWRDGDGSPSPQVNDFHRAVVAMGLTAWDFPLIDRIMGGGATAFDYYFEVMVPGRITDTHTLFVPTPGGSAMLEVHDLQRPIGGGEALPLLRALVPSLRAGVEAFRHLAGRRAALATTIDALDAPAAAFDADGRELHRNTALVRLLDAEPESVRITAALERTAGAARRLAFGRAGDAAARGTGRSAAAGRETATARGRYAFRPTVLPDGLVGPGGGVLVTVRADVAPTLPTSESVRERHGLTRREAEVALLLAEGLSNAALSERLFVSPHTARHHVESVMAKLGAPSRAAVAARLLSEARGTG